MKKAILPVVIVIMSLAIAFAIYQRHISNSVTSTEIAEVTFSKPGGFYDKCFKLKLSCGKAYHIRYTTNGSSPTASSALYTKPLQLDEKMYSKSNIYTIVNCETTKFYHTDDVDRCIVIRAAVYDENERCVSDVVTNSYFISGLGCDTHGLPVVSITADSLALFDYDTGIFVPGASFDTTRPSKTGNYYNRGRKWEKLVNFEFYELDNSGVNQECGMRTHGNASRRNQQKGVKLYARKEYGKQCFEHKFFDNCDLSSFKHLCLHPFKCSSWLQTGGQDYVANRVAANLDLDAMAVREVAVYINGEYWGIYTLEESPDEHYLKEHYNADLKKVNVMKYWIGIEEHGDPTDWTSFFSWLEKSDLTKPEDSIIAFSRMDIPNLIDYFLIQIYGADIDWPNNNVRLWQPADGEKFRMIFFDGDGCFIRYRFNAIENAADHAHDSYVFNHFMKNDAFRNMFYDRYLELKHTYFSCDSVKKYLDGYHDIVAGEIQKQSQRFGFPKHLKQWYHDLDSIYDFIERRAEVFEQQFKEHFTKE